MIRNLFVLLILLPGYTSLFSQNDFDINCFSIVVGKKASADGSVFIAHNEDDEGQNFVDLHKVPRIQHHTGEKQIFVNKLDSIDEVEETFGYFWITGSCYNEEQYVNEWGVAITSDGSRSKVVEGDARIQHNLRRIVAERARTAREAVKIAGALVEKYGYTHPGRTYIIADPNEAWILEVTFSKHWIARRVPDDEVTIVPNYYVIDHFDRADTVNYLSSPDIIEYAINKGWYDPKSDTAFNFRKVYGRKDRHEAMFNIARKWVILNKLSEKQYGIHDNFPFSFKSKQKIKIQDLMSALQNHYEGTPFENFFRNYGCPHKSLIKINIDTLTVCNGFNDCSSITQLRNWLPADIGNIVWMAPRYPCIQPFIPWYYGITKISPEYEKANYAKALQDYNIKNRDYKMMYPDHACWIFDDLATRVDSSNSTVIESIKKWKYDFETGIFRKINKEEIEILKIYQSNPDSAKQMLTTITNGLAEKALIDTKNRLMQMNSQQ